MKFENYMILDFPSRSSNEAFARSAVACFAAQLDPTLEELGDIRTAVSEAVTNCIVHAYPEKLGNITLRCRILKNNSDLDNVSVSINVPQTQFLEKGFVQKKITSSGPIQDGDMW